MTAAQDIAGQDLERRIAAVRRFNRFYTRQIGVLRKTYLDSPYSLGESRLLYEIAQRGAVTASEIGRALDLDAGYLSRVLRDFEKRGLIVRKASATDARQSHVTLSARGRKTFAPLEHRSQGSTAAMLGALDAAAQTRLTEAMATIEACSAARGDKQDRPRAATACARRSPAISAGSSSATASFTRRSTAGPSRSKACARRSSPTSSTTRSQARALLDRGDQRRQCRLDHAGQGDRNHARIRLLLVDPSARGLGLGARLTDECIRFARRAKYQKITLWTHSVLEAARHIYAKAGFKLMRSERHRSWGRAVVSEHWDLE